MIRIVHLRRIFVWAALAGTIFSADALLAQFTVTTQPTQVVLASNTATTTTTAVVTPQGGFTGGVNLTCNLSSKPDGARALPQCIVGKSGTSPVVPTVTISSSAAATATLTLYGPLAVRPPAQAAKSGGLLLGGLAALIFFLATSRKSGWRRVSALCALMFAVLMTGCSAINSVQGIVPGTYTYQVTAITQQTSTSTPVFSTFSYLVVSLQ